MRLEEIYDEILVPLRCSVEENGELHPGQALLLENNLEEAMYRLSPKMIKRRRNGKTALCAAPAPDSRMGVNVLSILLEVEGWDSMNLGENVAFEVMSQMVETEPINLVCIFFSGDPKHFLGDCKSLNKIARSYRIPIVLACSDSDQMTCEDLDYEEKFSDFSSFRSYLATFRG